MIIAGVLVLWAGYGLTSWGWCLVKGYNIPLSAWFGPVHGWQWPDKGSPAMVPAGHIFPAAGDAAPGTSGATSASAATGGAATAGQQRPGGVASRL